MAGVCAKWADHEFGDGRYIGGGRHPVMGNYQTFEKACRRPGCGRRVVETRWTGLPLGQRAGAGLRDLRATSNSTGGE